MALNCDDQVNPLAGILLAKILIVKFTHFDVGLNKVLFTL